MGSLSPDCGNGVKQRADELLQWNLVYGAARTHSGVHVPPWVLL